MAAVRRRWRTASRSRRQPRSELPPGQQRWPASRRAAAGDARGRRVRNHQSGRSRGLAQLDESVGAQGQADLRAGQDGRVHGRGGHGPFAQAGHHLRHPQGPFAQRREHLRRRRAGNPAGRLRLPAFLRRLVPRRPGRHLRVAQPDPPLQPAHRRLHLRPDPPAERRRALLRVAQGRRNQFRFARVIAQQGAVREPDAVPSHQAAQAAAWQWLDRRSHRTRHRPGLAHRQGPARSHRLAAQGRQDHAAAEHRHVHHRQSSGSAPHRAAHRRAARRK